MSVPFRRDAVILACAISAGIHGALAPGHEGASATAAFVVAATTLALLAIALSRRPELDLLYVVAATVLLGLIASYALAVTAGVPLVHPEPEPVGGLALATKAIEAAGAAAAVSVRTAPAPLSLGHAQTKGA